MDKSDYLSGKASENRRTNNVWGMFFSFIRRASKFMKYMKNRSINQQFELFLQTVGRDPTCYREEGWSEFHANHFDPLISQDIIYHKRKLNGRNIVGEFLLNDFRFWNEIQCFKRQAEYLNNTLGIYNQNDEEMLSDKARLICDQFLSSHISPKVLLS